MGGIVIAYGYEIFGAVLQNGKFNRGIRLIIVLAVFRNESKIQQQNQILQSNTCSAKMILS